MSIKIGIVGCAGRMGQMLMKEVLDTAGAELAGGTERPGGAALGKDIGELLGRGTSGLIIGGDARALFQASDVVIDFTSRDATVIHARLAQELGKALVVGTTGLEPEHEAVLHEAAAKVPVVYAPNFSVGVNLLMSLVEKVASILDPSYDIEIVEMHHRHKVDSPSGTALGLGRAAAAGRQVALSDVWVKQRDGIVGARKSGEIGFAALRGGDVVGDHTVMFAAEGERIELTHKAQSRAVFSKGAVRAALWTASAKAGLYDMFDVLGLKA